MHIGDCLDKQMDHPSKEVLEKLPEVGNFNKYCLLDEDELEPEVWRGAPDFDNMSTEELKDHMTNYGMKTSFKPDEMRKLLRETWLYVNHNIFPESLRIYLPENNA